MNLKNNFNFIFCYLNLIFEFPKILLLSETYRIPIGDLSEAHQRPICQIADLDPRRVSLSDGSPIRHVGFRWASDNNNIFCELNNKYIFKYIHVKIPVGLHRHVGIRWVSTDMLVSDSNNMLRDIDKNKVF